MRDGRSSARLVSGSQIGGVSTAMSRETRILSETLRPWSGGEVAGDDHLCQLFRARRTLMAALPLAETTIATLMSRRVSGVRAVL